MFSAGGDDVDAGGVDVGVSQNIGQFRQIPVDGIKAARKQVPQVVRKDLAALHPSLCTERFHHPPDARAVQRPPRAGDEYPDFICGGNGMPQLYDAVG